MTGEEPSADRVECPYCEAAFARERHRDLHVGQAHDEALTHAEREAYEAAEDAEREDLRLFRLKALAALVLVYFGFLILYAFSL
ncbi:C2H2-type zinc finger protein [Salinirubellus salinus]|uniref:C2H2-type zinc finger protein n=1 Tax=Salinirubellus salinus TaxID=1364945 RepID=A0A9E7R4Y5_9EURY|nr:C2H2-type zinc finger protein [Salinirubellus salinus]UWM55284.1 C2H2-type zinc finger protein [Salinirubellus salinus]